MSSKIKSKATIVGLFLFFGVVILVAGILTIGNLHNSFVRKFMITTIFDEVNGLQPGNNIWFSGVKIGTVSTLNFYGKSQVIINMKIDNAAQNYIKKDAQAKISSDGLIGNKIIVIFGGSDNAPCVEAGDTIGFMKTLSTDDMLNTLQENFKNFLSITGDFKIISKRILDGEGTVGKLLSDESLYNSLEQTVASLGRASDNAAGLTASLSEFSSKLNQEGSLTNDIVTDTVVFNTLKSTVLELKQMVSSAGLLVTSLKEAGSGLNSPASPAGILLHDAPAGTDLRAVLKNLESSTKKLDQDLEALQHNFLLRRFFRKKAN